jgi:hypothetical protein
MEQMLMNSEDSQRYVQLIDYLDEVTGPWDKIPPERRSQFPFNVLLEQGPVVNMANRLSSELSGFMGLQSVYMPGVGEVIFNPADTPEDSTMVQRVREALTRQLNSSEGGCELNPYERQAIISYVRPELPYQIEEGLMPLNEAHRSLRSRYASEFMRDFNQRGHAVEVTDPTLLECGYRRIEFKRGRDLPDPSYREVTVFVGEQEHFLKLYIMPDGRLVDPNTNIPITRSNSGYHPTAAVLFESFVLNHATEIVSTVNEEGESMVLEGERAETYRTGHIRHVSQFEFNPTDQALRYAQQEKGDAWVARIQQGNQNIRERNEGKERRDWDEKLFTYVRETPMPDEVKEAMGLVRHSAGERAQDVIDMYLRSRFIV